MTIALMIKVKRRDVLCRNQQSGAALIVGMIMLLGLTIIGLSAMQGVSMQERMSGNMRDSTMAIQSAEVGLRYVEDSFLAGIEELDKGVAYSACAGACQIVNSSEGETQPVDDMMNGSTDWDAEAMNYGAFSDSNGNAIHAPTGSGMGTKAAIPQLMVEYVVFKRDELSTGTGVVDDTGLDMYRTSAKANGGTTNSEAILQTIYARRFR
jgi:type IV pilus assembly protein PilX